MSGKLSQTPQGYAEWLNELKARIHSAQQRATLAVNTELLMLYWSIGNDFLARQQEAGWGAKVLEQVAKDLKSAFPEMKGFSRSNLMYMRLFAESWPEAEIVQQVVGQLPWGHNIALLTKLKDLSLGAEATERDIEAALVQHITRFLLELGAGFAFVGRQVHLEVGGDDFYVDLLFYHLKLRCYIVIELKAADFKPEHTGQLSFYLTAVDAQVKAPDDAPTIGLLLCKGKNKVVAEYALRNNSQPIGVAEYQLVESLPEELQSSLPSIEDIEREMSSDD